MEDSLKAEIEKDAEIFVVTNKNHVFGLGNEECYIVGATKYAAELSALREERDALKAELNEIKKNGIYDCD